MSEEKTDLERALQQNPAVAVHIYNGMTAIKIDGHVWGRSGGEWIINLIRANLDAIWPEPIEEEENVEA